MNRRKAVKLGAVAVVASVAPVAMAMPATLPSDVAAFLQAALKTTKIVRDGAPISKCAEAIIEQRNTATPEVEDYHDFSVKPLTSDMGI